LALLAGRKTALGQVVKLRPNGVFGLRLLIWLKAGGVAPRAFIASTKALEHL
jgi:hypothetical protein